MHDALAIYSCDDHLDLSAVPPGLWESRLSAADAERGPRVVKGDKGSVWMCEGAMMGRRGMPPNAKFVKQDTGLPISFHIKGGTSGRLSYQIGKWQSAAFATLLPLQLDEPLATMVFSGALERHPGLKLVLAESGVGWLPYFLTRMDLEWNALRDKLDYAPSIAPSELFRRQVIATFEEESLA